MHKPEITKGDNMKAVIDFYDYIGTKLFEKKYSFAGFLENQELLINEGSKRKKKWRKYRIHSIIINLDELTMFIRAFAVSKD